MELFLFLQLFFLVSLTYGTRDEASSSQPVVPSGDGRIRYTDCVCRLNTKNRIIGGEEALAHSIPWQVSLADSVGNHFCGATIINPYYVLTSASCLGVKKKEEIKVRVGLHNIDDPIPIENVFDVEEIHPYIPKRPFFPTKPRGVGDIALLRLKRKIKFVTGLVEPACLNFFERQYPDKLMISGWGYTNTIERNTVTHQISPGKLSHFLKISYLDQQKNCVQPHLICANSKSLSSPCHGDEGGPLHSDVDIFTLVEGVLTELMIKKVTESKLEYHCIGSSFYSRISFYKNWIRETIDYNYCGTDLALKRKRKIDDDPNDMEKRIKIDN